MKPKHVDTVSIDGDYFTQDQADTLLENNLVEQCPDAGGECPHDYHAREGYTGASLRGCLALIAAKPEVKP